MSITLDIKNQCSGFIYRLSIYRPVHQNGQYKEYIVGRAEMHSMGLDFTTREGVMLP